MGDSVYLCLLSECNQLKHQRRFSSHMKTFLSFLLTLEPAKPRPQHAGKRDWAAETGHIYSGKVIFEQRVVISSLKDMANDKDTVDIYGAGSLEPVG